MTERIGQCKGPRSIWRRAAQETRQTSVIRRQTSTLRPQRRLWLLLIAAASLPGCTVGPNFTPPKPDIQAGFWPAKTPASPAQIRPSVTEPDPIDPNWWTLFGDPELTALESRLAAGNLDIATYIERLGESRAQLGVARADELPTLDANGSYTRELPSNKGVIALFSGGGGGTYAASGSVGSGASGTTGGIPVASKTIPPFNLFQYGFDASWELDIFGHARREVEAAKANVQAAQEQGRTALVSAEAELARDYIELRGVQQQIAITRADLKAFNDTLQLTRERAQAGLTTTLDVANSTAQLATSRAELPQLEAQQVQALNALCLLLGEQPGALDAELLTPAPVPPVPPVVPVGLPSELARRRPDIRAAEAQLHAATAQIGVAVADFYPQIQLSGSIGLQALQAKDLGNWAARTYGLGPTISLPIFEGGRLRATLELRKGEQREAAIAYRQTVLSALADVSNALTSYDQEQIRRVQLQNAAQQNERAVSLATQRYRDGLTSFIDVLDAQRQELSAEQQLTDSTTTVSTDLVALYKALGGGWSEQIAEK
jgi:NodT family efflux transporter outer membrane factor (OMF) lipoprotein